MQLTCKVNSCRLQKVAFCLAFFCFLCARAVAGLGLPPVILAPPLGITVHKGDTATFTATVAASLTPLTITWYFGNKALKNADISTVQVPGVNTTVTTLTIPNANASDAGSYWIKAENASGSASSGNAILVVLDPLTTVTVLTSDCGMTNGGFRLNLVKPQSSNCVIDASTDFVNWTPLYTNATGSTNVSYLDAAATNMTFRYYRARLQ